MSVQPNPQMLQYEYAEVDENPLSDNEYVTILEDTYCQLQGLVIRQDNDETASKTIEVRITLDGVTFEGSLSCNNASTYGVYRYPMGDSLVIGASTTIMLGYYAPLHGHNVKLEVKISSVLGTNQRLRARLSYGQPETAPYWWYKSYAISEVNQDPPVVDTYYDLLTDLNDVRLIYLVIKRADDDVLAQNVEINAVFDSTTINRVKSMSDNSWYFVSLSPTTESFGTGGAYNNVAWFDSAEVQYIESLQIRQTGAVGDNATFDGRAVYELYEEVS